MRFTTVAAERPAAAPASARFARWQRLVWVATAAVLPVAALPSLHASVLPSGTPERHAVVAARAVDQTQSLQPVQPQGLIAWPTAPDSAPAGSGSRTPNASGAPANTAQISPLAADGIPLTALIAYERAAEYIAATDSSCGLPWPLLAAIGRVESDHGRYAGAVLRADGTSSRRVIGIALDGIGTALIRDTDHGRLDGDTVYDRAVGPMQFIPSTWASFGRDGNADGLADPFNVFDAAAAAAHYLCVAGGNLRTLAGQARAVLAYNHSDSYLATVLGLERTYAAGVPGLVVPTGPPPPAEPPASVPKVPPVDPGPPRGVRRPGPPTGSPPSPSAAPSGHPTQSSSSSSSASSSASPSGSSSPAPTPTNSESPSCPAPSMPGPTNPPTDSSSPSTSPTPSCPSSTPGPTAPSTTGTPPDAPSMPYSPTRYPSGGPSENR